MIGYKHVPLASPPSADPEQFQRMFETGETIRIGSFAYYRAMENDRADPDEGLATNGFQFPAAGALTDPRFALARASMGLSWQGFHPNANVYIQNMSVARATPPAHLFCCSWEPDQSLVKEGQAIFEIADLDEFANALVRAKRVLGSFTVDRVVYENRRRDPFGPDGPAVVGPFRKSDLFSQEREIRIVWHTAGYLRPPVLNITAPECAAFIKRIA